MSHSIFIAESALFNSNVGVSTAGLDDGVSMNLPSGTTSLVPLRLNRGVLTATPVCGNLGYDGHFAVDMCGGLRTYVDCTFFVQHDPITITDVAPGGPNLEVSLLGTGNKGTKILPAHSLRLSKIVRVRNRTLLSTKTNKGSYMRFKLDGNVLESYIQYTSNTTNVYAEIDVDMVVQEVVGGLATVNVAGRTIFGTGASGAGVGMRFIHGTISNVNTALPNDIEITFQWENARYDAANTLTTILSTLQYLD